MFIEILLRYTVATAEDLNINELCAIAEKDLDQSKGSNVMTLAKQLFENGKNEGIQRTLYKLYTKRFGIAVKIEEKISKISDLNKLEELFDLLYESTNSSDFIREL